MPKRKKKAAFLNLKTSSTSTSTLGLNGPIYGLYFLQSRFYTGYWPVERLEDSDDGRLRLLCRSENFLWVSSNEAQIFCFVSLDILKKLKHYCRQIEEIINQILDLLLFA